MDRLLLHTCCAPCSVYCVDSLREEGIEPVSFWYNPNIHPYQEYKARRDTLKEYAASIGLSLLVREDYGLRDFVRAVAGNLDHRCGHCYACTHGRHNVCNTLEVTGVHCDGGFAEYVVAPSEACYKLDTTKISKDLCGLVEPYSIGAEVNHRANTGEGDNGTNTTPL